MFVSVGGDVVEQWSSHCISGDHDQVGFFVFDSAPHVGGIKLSTQNHFVANKTLSHHAPLRCAVHQRRQWIRHQRETSASFFHKTFWRRNFLTAHDVDSATESHHHVAMTPHHALGHSGGAASKQKVDVIVRTWREITSIAIACQRLFVFVANHEHW